jgi:hypothetical protein
VSTIQKILACAVLLVVATLGLGLAQAEETPRAFDRSIAHVVSSSTYIDVSAANYTSYVNCLTIEPADNFVMTDVQIVIDLDAGNDTDGFAGGYTSETIQFAVARKIQGNWRVDDNLETATLAGSSAGDRSQTLDVGTITPTEDCRIYVKLSAEQTDVELPFVLIYKSGADATLTTVSN